MNDKQISYTMNENNNMHITGPRNFYYLAFYICVGEIITTV